MRSLEQTIEVGSGFFDRFSNLKLASAKALGAAVAAACLFAGCSSGETKHDAAQAVVTTVTNPETSTTTVPETSTTSTSSTTSTTEQLTPDTTVQVPETVPSAGELIPDSSIGGLILGKPVDDYFDDGYTVTPACGGTEVMMLDGPAGHFVGQLSADGIVVGLTTMSPDVKSAAGLGVGSTETEVRSALGSHVYERQVDSDSGPLTLLGPNNILEVDAGMFYTINSGDVIAMSLFENDGITPTFGC